MGRIRAKNTKPEMAVRSILHRLGYRFRLHQIRLPGKPDIVLPRLKAVVFVHGCFWHRHRGCSYCSTPSANGAYWRAKFIGNQRRDRENAQKLRKVGWRPTFVWECELRDPSKLEKRLLRALRPKAESL